ncbi:MAG: hypothetical protein ACKO3R_04335 [bacterium]
MCEGVGFNPAASAAGSVNLPVNVNSTRITGDTVLDAIGRAGNVPLNGGTQKLLYIGQAMKDLGITS